MLIHEFSTECMHGSCTLSTQFFEFKQMAWLNLCRNMSAMLRQITAILSFGLKCLTMYISFLLLFTRYMVKYILMIEIWYRQHLWRFECLKVQNRFKNKNFEGLVFGNKIKPVESSINTKFAQYF